MLLIYVLQTLCITDGCSKGQELSSNGSCVDCAIGFYKEAGLSMCIQCEIGFVTNKTGAYKPEDCNVGKKGSPSSLLSHGT